MIVSDDDENDYCCIYYTIYASAVAFVQAVYFQS